MSNKKQITSSSPYLKAAVLSVLKWCFCLFFLFSFEVQAQKHLNLYQLPLEGLSDVEVQSIYQDHYGFLWFGTANGLNRFDGQKYIHFSYQDGNESSLSSNQVNAIIEDGKNNLWVGTKYGLNKFDRNTNTFKRYLPATNDSSSIPGKNIKVLFLDQSQNLWIGTNEGLSQYDADADQFINYFHQEGNPNSLSGNSVNQIIQDSKGRLWVGTNYSGVSLFEPEKNIFINFKHEPSDPESLSGNTIISLFEDSYKNIWIGTIRNGLNRFDESTHTFKHYSQGSHRGSLATNSIYSITENMDRNLIIGGMQGGMSIYNRNTDTFVRYNTKGQINLKGNTASVLTDFITKEKQILIATSNGGVNIYDNHPSNFITYQQNPINDQGLSIDHVTALLTDDRGLVWIGTNGGGLNQFDPESEKFTHFLKSNQKGSLMDNTILSISKFNGKDILLLNTQLNGLATYNRSNGQFSNIDISLTNAQETNIISIVIDQLNKIWISTAEQLFVLKDLKASPEKIIQLKGEGDETFSSLLEDKNGNLLATTNLGIYQIENTSAYPSSFLPFPKSPNQNFNINGITEDPKGQIWIFTQQAGIWRLEEKKFIQIPSGSLAQKQISNLFFIDEALWVTADNGLFRCKLNNDSINIVNHYTPTDGLPNSVFSRGAVAESKDGHYFLGSLGGLSSFHPDSLQTNPNIPPIVLTSLSIDNKKVPQGTKGIMEREINQMEQIILPEGSNDFSLSFASLNYIKPEKNQYAYKLEGIDEDWTYTTHTSANYVDLPPGSYTFTVKGSNNDGLWNENGRSIIIKVPGSSYFSSFWLVGLFILLVLSGAFIFITKQKLSQPDIIVPQKHPVPRPVLEEGEIRSLESKEESSDDFFERAKAIVLDHLQEESFDVNMLSRELGTSRTQLYRKFKENNGETVSSFIKEIKLNKAHQLLTTCQFTITEVFQMSGFKSASHFSKSFQSRFGQSPSELMTQHKRKTKQTSHS
ncbi:helix-turn-helix domain-containing protein [Echinicola sp. CAU 1574]|uniref:Helix-turn-helix domain-containing protein n=1 Tax=Echinicola arenosa TaxID=2774144 RepID=A0ABR9AHK0_9BACT|nr:two-component regulator propeller domain-containing protein [Echinicola arenosa]MBD8488185.1 helix-turn-helix domain-containing protein [Echinicola arenosa]